MKRKLILCLSLALVLCLTSIPVVALDVDPTIIEESVYLVNTDSFPELTKAIKEIKDPVKQDLIIQYLFTPTSIEYKVVDRRTYQNDVEQNNRNAGLVLLAQVDKLKDMQVSELTMKVAEVKEKGKEIMKGFNEPLDYNSFINDGETKAITVNSYWKNFVRQAKSGSFVVMDLSVEMDWQSEGNNITYVAPTSVVTSYVFYWVAYNVSQETPVVYGSYATLTGKTGRFHTINSTGENFYITMPMLRVNANGTYSPTSIPSVPAPE